jgi:hypothetical protein
MKKKHYKIQSQKGYWFEALSLFTDDCLTKKEKEEYKHELAQRLADLVKNNCVLDDVNNSTVKVCKVCKTKNLHYYPKTNSWTCAFC